MPNSDGDVGLDNKHRTARMLVDGRPYPALTVLGLSLCRSRTTTSLSSSTRYDRDAPFYRVSPRQPWP